ncbi:LOW QUALITY PROTEIN: Hypothetical protein PHPALM_36388 [Phytophthora palmivora]|uniref:Uncharacterized protein n=1 Tax=Phytophthora palmivora TaxID=4796 RepID=A0A2P4X041_9STRA|nr:LOW QUALITY PROTEIN: Hypothetical protein PHPALM_36388 [Phytophthora palmivora]
MFPDKTFKQYKAMGKINNEKQLCYSTVVSILGATFARKVGCHNNKSQTLEREGAGRSPYKIEGRTRLKVTLAGSLRISASLSLMGRYDCPTKSAFRWLVGIRSTATWSNMCVGRIFAGSISDKRSRSGYAVKRQTSISYESPGEIDGADDHGSAWNDVLSTSD